MLNTPLVNYDAVGRCADILKLNPIELSTSQLSELAFDLGDLKDNKAVLGPISYSLPERLEFRIDAGADRDKTVSELSSSYDFQTFLKSSAAIQVSDPAGSLYSASASAAFEDLKSNTTKNNNVVTYASITVWLWWLKVLDETPLSDRLKTAFQQLPVDDEGPYEKLIAKFGTHYLREAFFGGRATQVIKVSTVDYAGLIQRNVDISVQAALTLGLKASAAAESKDTRKDEFTKSTSLTVEKIRVTGGLFQDYTDSWAGNIPSYPMPVKSKFSPLYELLVPDLVLSDDKLTDKASLTEVKQKQSLLKKAIESYLSKNGRNPAEPLLNVGDVIELELATAGPSRILSAGDDTRVSILRRDDLNGGHQDKKRQQWRLVRPQGQQTGAVAVSPASVILECAATGNLLDAQSGSDDVYPQGRGLVGAVASDQTGPGVHWMFELAGRLDRTVVVDGDVVRLRTQWKSPKRGENGYLLGPEDINDREQRVYGFGSRGSQGAAWVIRRVSGTK